MPDYYRVLGVSPSASQDEIKRAYRRLAREHHPDASKAADAEERFKEINAAYEILSDPARRERYDMFGDASATATFGGFGDLGDLMESFFGAPFGRTRARSSRRPVATRGADVETHLRLSFAEAVFGADKTIQLRAVTRCERCAGSGCEPGTMRTRCERCGGTGEFRHVQRSIFGTMMTSRPCGACEGTGEVAADPCRACSGQGRLIANTTVTVEVPPGVEDGMTLRVRGRGEAGARGGEPGDLYVHLDIAPHPQFRREGSDIVCTLSVAFTQAALGARVPVQTLDGEETVSIPAGTQPGASVRIRGKGVPGLQGGGRGDLVVRLEVEVPRKLTAEQRELVEKLAATRGEAAGDAGAGKLGKLRNVLRGK
jgi:molecular chaperone DnaJ